MMDFKEKLFALKDASYKEFHAKLIPNVDPERVIGVRMPQLRRLAKKWAGSAEATVFMDRLPHYYYEENNLHAAFIEYGGYSFAQTIAYISEFLPYIDNWATCDMLNSSVLAEHSAEMKIYIKEWLASQHGYTVRFGLNCLMRSFLSEQFDPMFFDWVNAIDIDDYYVKMGIAWYYSVALVHQWEPAFSLIQSRTLDPWIQNKAIQKARESYRISDCRKVLLNEYKIKGKNHERETIT